MGGGLMRTTMKISPATKYTLGRVGLFALAVVIMLVVPMPGSTDEALLLRLLIAAVVSAIASWFLLARWRAEMAGTIERTMSRRKVEKEKLRAALAGDDDPDTTA
jgi:Protein of unknown function (DUF4229)